jgi:hypothetical protein
MYAIAGTEYSSEDSTTFILKETAYKIDKNKNDIEA